MTRMTHLVFLSPAFAMAACGSPSGNEESHSTTSEPVINGTPVSTDTLGTTLLSINGNEPGGPWTCSGTLVRPSWVLTSQRCVTQNKGRVFGVPINPVNLTATLQGGVNGPIGAQIVLGQFTDLALVLLSDRPVSDRSFQGIPIYRGDSHAFLSQSMRTQGWGSTAISQCDFGPPPGTGAGRHLNSGAVLLSGFGVVEEINIQPNSLSQIFSFGDYGTSLFTTVASRPKAVGVLSTCSCTDNPATMHGCAMEPTDTNRGWIDGIIGRTTPAVATASAGYERSDGWNAVPYVRNRAVREVALNSNVDNPSWSVGNLEQPGMPFTALGNTLAAYVRSDGRNTVVFRDENQHIQELRLEGGWRIGDLTKITGAVAASLGPSAYVRDDGFNSVLFTGVDQVVYELVLEPFTTKWVPFNLFHESGATTPAAGAPVGYVREDGVSSVLYVGTDGDIYELTLVRPGFAGGQQPHWVANDLTAILGAPKPVGTTVHPFTTSDGFSGVVYRTANNHVELLTLPLSNSRWFPEDLTADFGGPTTIAEPMGFVRADGVIEIAYTGNDLFIHLLERQIGSSRWAPIDLSSTGAAPATTDAPSAYVRSDGFTALVYRNNVNMHQVELKHVTASLWRFGDMTPNGP